jgi:Autophagy protein Apg9.
MGIYVVINFKYFVFFFSDIHHRILRQKNYLIALQNKGVIDYLFRFPFLGERLEFLF